MIPKVKFKKMTLEENVSLVKWMLFNKDVGFNMQEATLGYFPDLKEVIYLDTKEEQEKAIVKFLKECYKYSDKTINKDIDRYNLIWEEYNDDYFTSLTEYLNIEWPKDKLEIEARVGLIPIFPRFLDSFSFALSFAINKETLIEVVSHECLHFIFFEKWKELYKDANREEFEAPYLVWKYSEMVTDPILNSDKIKSVININEKAYDEFYKIKDNEEYMMDKLINIYNKDMSIEDKIKDGFEYVKSIVGE